jgi:Zn-dependent peptidase ImmA (M78 family)
MKVRRRLVRAVVDQVLEQHAFAISPEGTVNPIEIAKANDISVERFTLEESLSGFLLNQEGSFLIGVNNEDGESRQRFTIAHELGHYFLHDRTTSYMDTKTGHFSVTPRNEVSSAGVDPKEIEANLFAAELLMPEESIRQEMEKLGAFGIFDDKDEEIRQLAKTYQVSVKALTIRLERLGFITEG